VIEEDPGFPVKEGDFVLLLKPGETPIPPATAFEESGSP
jgi:hypothetical protein